MSSEILHGVSNDKSYLTDSSTLVFLFCHRVFFLSVCDVFVKADMRVLLERNCKLSLRAFASSHLSRFCKICPNILPSKKEIINNIFFPAIATKLLFTQANNRVNFWRELFREAKKCSIYQHRLFSRF